MKNESSLHPCRTFLYEYNATVVSKGSRIIINKQKKCKKKSGFATNHLTSTTWFHSIIRWLFLYTAENKLIHFQYGRDIIFNAILNHPKITDAFLLIFYPP